MTVDTIEWTDLLRPEKALLLPEEDCPEKPSSRRQ
jgi:hypothetical protein